MSVTNRTYQLGGIAFVLGNLLFFVNKLDEMSRLFLGRWMPDLISGQNSVLILLGQVALIMGYVAYYQFYSRRLGWPGKILLALGHGSFMSVMLDFLPSAENLFLLVLFGMLCLLIGLIWFGILNLRQPVLSHWPWLPLATGLMGFIGFFLFSGEEITATFLLFRTPFALGLIGLGLILWMEKPIQPGLGEKEATHDTNTTSDHR